MAVLARLVRDGEAVAARAIDAGFTAAAGDHAGNFEVVRDQAGGLTIEGWLLASGAGLDSIEAVSPGGGSTAATLIARPDVAAAFPGADAGTAGFAVTLPVRKHALDGSYDVTLEGRRGDIVFSCRLVRAAGPRVAAPAFDSDGVLRV